MRLDREEVQAAAVSWIDSKRVVLWGIGVDVTKPENLEAAAHWLTDQIEGVLANLDK